MRVSTLCSLATVLAVSAILPVVPVYAQAWVAPRGETSLSLTFQSQNFTGHYTSDGKTLPLGGSQAHSLLLEIDHSVTDRFALSASLPFAVARNGSDPSPTLGHTGIDDGHYHGSWQDYRVGARFSVHTDLAVVTPFVELVIPSHGYPTEGEAAIGRGLRETRLGINVGRRLDPILPRVVLHARYMRSFVQKLEDIGTDRDNLDLESAYLLNDRWTVRAIGRLQQTEGGLNFPGDVLHDPDLFQAHDRILDDDHIRLGAGLSFSLTDSIDLDAAYTRTVRGSDTHIGGGFALGISWVVPRR